MHPLLGATSLFFRIFCLEHTGAPSTYVYTPSVTPVCSNSKSIEKGYSVPRGLFFVYFADNLTMRPRRMLMRRRLPRQILHQNLSKKGTLWGHLPQSIFISKQKRDEIFSPLFHTILLARYSVLYDILFSEGI